MPMFLDKPFTFDRAARSLFTMLIVTVLLCCIYGLREVLIPFALSFIFAYVLLPIVHFVQYKLRVRKRILSVLLVLLFIASLITLAIIVVIPAVEEEVGRTWILIRDYVNPEALLSILPESIREYVLRNVNLDSIIKEISAEKLFEGGKEVVTQLSNVINSTISVVAQIGLFAMGLLYFFFILNDFEDLVRGLIRLFPEEHRYRVREIVADVDGYMNRYFRGQAMIAVSVGIMLAIGYKTIGLPLGITIGICIGLLNFVPYMQILGIPALVFLAALKAAQTGANFFWILLVTLGVLLLVQIIQDTILVPRIMGKQMGMRPSTILLSLTIWGSLLGLLGLIIALPMTMSMYSVYMRFVIKDSSYIRNHESNRDQARRSRHRKLMWSLRRRKKTAV